MSWATKYRPTDLRDVVGQSTVRKSLEALLKKPEETPHCFLFSGSAGVGKTTLARIMVQRIGRGESILQEFDAASYSGVDAVKTLVQQAKWRALGDSKKCIIIDECHRLSREAWDALLAITEDSPAHLYIFLCTTQPDKVPKTVQSRSMSYALKDLNKGDLLILLDHVVAKERLNVTDGVVEVAVDLARGSARAALSILESLQDCHSRADALEQMNEYEDAIGFIDLIRIRMQGEKLRWNEEQQIIAKAKEDGTTAESIRIISVAYIPGWITKAKEPPSEDQIYLLSQFTKPWNPLDKYAPLILALNHAIQ